MKNLLKLKFVFLTVAFVFLFSFTADAQRRRTPRPRTATKTASPAAVINAAAVKEAEQTVANQVKNLSQFLYLLGGSVSTIKAIELEAKEGKLTDNAKQQSELGKKGLVSTITIFKNAMLKLESDFRANPALKPYLLQLTGVGETAGTAEDQARAGQFDQSGRSLIQLVDQLTEVLIAMK